MLNFDSKDEFIEHIRMLNLAAVLTPSICASCMTPTKIENSIKVPLDDPDVKGLVLPICGPCIPFITNKEIDDLHLQRNALELVESGMGELVA